jgi:hypothetical protein
MHSPDMRRLLRRSQLAGTALCLLVTCYSLWRYPGIMTEVGPVAAAVFAAVFVFYCAAALYLTHDTRPEANRDARLGLFWGILIAGLWSVEVAAGNLMNPEGFGVPALYFGATALAFIAPLFAGMAGGRQSGRILGGSLVGLFSGLVSGLLTFLIIMGMCHVFLDRLLLDPQNQAEFRRGSAPDIATFVVGDCLAGALGHLVIGLVLGPVLGTIGGVLGKSLARHRPPSSRAEPAMPLV